MIVIKAGERFTSQKRKYCNDPEKKIQAVKKRYQDDSIAKRSI